MESKAFNRELVYTSIDLVHFTMSRAQQHAWLWSSSCATPMRDREKRGRGRRREREGERGAGRREKLGLAWALENLKAHPQ